MRRVLIALIACLPLAGCDSLFSMAFPTRYAVTTVVDFDDGGRRSRQTVVSTCRVADQSSLGLGARTQVTGERHWIRRADGSLWVVGLLSVCRWGPKGPRGERAFRRFAVDPPPEQHDQSWPVGDSYTYRYDDPAEPTEVEAHRTRQLFTGGAEGLRLSGQLAAAGEAPSDTLRAAFPFLARVDAAAGAARAQRKGKPSGYRDYSISPGHFSGFEAQAHQLRGGACPAPDPDAEGPIRLERHAQCQFVNPCPTDRLTEHPCEALLGGLKPTFAPDFTRIDYSLGERDLAFVKRLARSRRLAEAGAPRHNSSWFEWNPQICLDGLCFELDRMSGGALLYYPKRNVLVDIHAAPHSARGQLFLAEAAPVWGGTD